MKRHRSASARCIALATLLAVGSAATGAGAAPDAAAKAECSAAYEKAQEQRSDGHLKTAKETAAVCARDACPAFVRSECKAWLDEITNDLPSVVIDAKDPSGQPTTSVVVAVDGKPYAESLDGKPIELDPGEHEFRFELGGAEPIEKREFLEKGAGTRAIHLTFASTAKPVDEAPVVASPVEQPSRTNLRPFAYVAGGVGAAGLIGFAVLGAMGKSKQSDLEKSCSPGCSQDEIDSVKSRFLLADISLGVGIVGLGAGVALFILSQPPKAEPAADARALKVDVKTSPGGAFATVSGAF